MIYGYFFTICVVRWSENSVRFENLMGTGFQMGQILCDCISQCEIRHVWGLQLRTGANSRGFTNDSGYPHDGRADKNPYRHDRRADKDSYSHDSNNQ